MHLNSDGLKIPTAEANKRELKIQQLTKRLVRQSCFATMIMLLYTYTINFTRIVAAVATRLGLVWSCQRYGCV